MRVRIQWKKSKLNETNRPGRVAALALAIVLAPGALAAFTMAGWRAAADLRWTGAFVVSTGMFSHWQAWLAAAAILLLSVSALDRYGRGGGETIS
jgi:hypothetical protein